LKPWDIYLWSFEGEGRHPAVIISHPDRVANKDKVCVLLCTSQRAGRAPLPHEVLLDQEDGLDWETLCKCDLVYAARREHLTGRVGAVVLPRRRAIAERVIKSMAFAGL
jgi:mRNA-degrading endonuclease toxin of MazEF toxin-antitoxin module